MPDFDIDFCVEGRDRVIDYCRPALRPATRFSQIITYGTMAAKAVLVRDCGRVARLQLRFLVDSNCQADSEQAGNDPGQGAGRKNPNSSSAMTTKKTPAPYSIWPRSLEGPGAQCRQARRWPGHRTGTVDRLHPALHRALTVLGTDPVRQERLSSR